MGVRTFLRLKGPMFWQYPSGAVFICGCGHSGTTLLANMFSAHPQVFIPLRETSAFHRPTDKDAKRHRDALVMDFRRSQKTYLVEKTPRHILHLDRIRALMPAPRFVLMVRDGRDVAASFLKRYGSPESGIERWLEAGEIILSQAGRHDVMLTRYEDLIGDPRRELERICAFSGIPFDEAMLRYHEMEHFWFGETEVRMGSGEEGDGHRALRNWQVNQPIFDGRRSWVGKLAPEALTALTQGRGGELMSAFGYEADLTPCGTGQGRT